MIQKLAIMVRQNVDWSSDSNTIKRELAFVEAYLSLQKYRFGERLSYQINAQEDCQNILVPKLTITTFVENACVHGIEAKSFPGWIFVRVYTEDDALCMEIEDTGGGMDEAEVERIQDRMRNASLKMLKRKRTRRHGEHLPAHPHDDGGYCTVLGGKRAGHWNTCFDSVPSKQSNKGGLTC